MTDQFINDDQLDTYDAEFYEDWGDDEAIHSRNGSQRVNTAKGRPLFHERPKEGFVTQGQLKASMEAVRREIIDNANAIKKVDGNTSTLATRIGKESAKTTKDLGAVRKMVMLSLLLPPKLDTPLVEVQSADPDKRVEKVISSVTVKQDILPLVLLSSMGKDTNGKESPDNNLLLPLLLTQQNGQSGDNSQLLLTLALMGDL